MAKESKNMKDAVSKLGKGRVPVLSDENWDPGKGAVGKGTVPFLSDKNWDSPQRKNWDSPRCGFTVIELLIVITIIGLLVALMTPAVQASREAARRTQCNNNLKQIGLATLNYDSAMKHLPNGGWIAWFLGHPDRGDGHKQPGGWIFGILPYLEQSQLYGLQAGKTGTVLKEAALQVIQTPLPVFICPTRRPVKLFTQPNSVQQVSQLNWQLEYYGNGKADESGVLTGVTPVARNDYCANGYDLVRMEQALVDTITAPAAANVLAGGVPVADAEIFDKPAVLSELLKIITSSNGAKGGIVYPLGHVTAADIGDGTSNTYLCGEKYVDVGSYENGECWGDQANMYSGYDAGNVRFSCKNAYPTVAQDNNTINYTTIWGSAHAGAFNMCFCDGSVRQVGYGISSTVHDQLGNRNDGNAVDLGAIHE